ncbi:hypothetical protein [Mycobacterium persicum]|uniref:hypothetical protein n=1 Tax=Mycobacterium persicum TaxID=1487726 RepID=UPI0016051298|nr:hypothetical protein [Mycobacterium persicum]
MGAIGVGGFTGDSQRLGQDMHTFLGALSGVCELFGVVVAEPFALCVCVVALSLQRSVEGGDGFSFDFHRVLCGGDFGAGGGEIGAEGGCFGCGLLGGFAR